MEKEMLAVVAIYKSEAVNYLNEKGIAREDAVIITTVENFEDAKSKLIKDVKLISAPMGLSSNEDDLKKLLVRTKEEEVNDLLGGANVQEVKGLPKGKTIGGAISGEAISEVKITEVDDKGEAVHEILKDLPPLKGTISSELEVKIPNEEEVKERLETPISTEEATKSLQEKVDALKKKEVKEPEVDVPNVREALPDTVVPKSKIVGTEKAKAIKKPRKNAKK